MPKTDPPVFFVSYARADIENKKFREHLETFVGDLSARVATGYPTSLNGVSFMDMNIHVGETWSEELRDALMRCRVGLTLYTPNYFTRRWCGQEFQVFLNRRRPGPGPSGIIPVRWMKTVGDPPECAARFQHNEGGFPTEYASRGMRQLVALAPKSAQDALALAYEDTLELLSARIIEAAKADRLAPLSTLNLDAVPSAWEAAAAADPQSHVQGNVSKTCFVFVSHRGWSWAPYEGTPAAIGALVQKITGELGLKYEEIVCDPELPKKLREANQHDVPTVLFGDPGTILNDPDPTYAQSLREYDALYLRNCGALVPWEPGVKDRLDDDPRWIHLKTKVCPQKIADSVSHHEWRSVFSREDLDLKTRILIEQIRSKLINQLVSDPNRATASNIPEDAALSQSAAARGINTASLSHLPSPSR